ncbi:putative secreted protein (Por secretion system target) [Neolewinella xylanilytica]|uniref:Putative secreted protein (Por secretion system target) n=1 Tax=Neolewinella xylanilytica TaxID=1514080 RepID=A0A2S6I4S7_9BACT|nr:kelch repeat-containing protein [Neolewinella xylanilytica]PPK86109.1 putative secreted protein (Por secretion system target) [Neolewinella xylanilytica]
MQTPITHQLLFLFLNFFAGSLLYAQTYSDWTKIGNAGYPRAEGQMVTYEGKYYWFNGFTTDLAFLNENERYDPATNTWTNLASIPLNPDGTYQGNTHVGISVVDDEIWLLGGRSGNPFYRVTDAVWIYDITDNAWRRGPTFPQRRGGGGLARLGRTLHYVGGFDHNTQCDVDDHWVYDLDNPEAGWQDFSGNSPMPLARNHFGTVTLGGMLYTIAGQHDHEGCLRGKNLPYVHRYDPYTDTWERLADLPFNNSHTEPSTFAYNGKLYSIGGQVALGQELAEYDPATNTWRILSEMQFPHRLIAPGARVHNGNLVVMVGGRRTVGRAQSEVWARTFTPNVTRKLAFHPATLRASGESRTTTEAILANYSGDDEATYRIDVSKFPAWLTIDRATGKARESFAEVEITVDPRGLPAGSYSYTLRATADGYTAASLPISFTVGEAGEWRSYADFREAECATVGSIWEIVSDNRAANGKYVTVPKGMTSTGSAPADRPENHVSFRYDVPKTGTYNLFARIAARATTDDSFWFRVNGGEWTEWSDNLVTENGAFEWRRGPGASLQLAAGEVTVDLAYRESGMMIDKLLLSAGSKLPVGTGYPDESCGSNAPSEPTATAYWAEAECSQLGSQWVTATDGGASAGRYVYAMGYEKIDAPGGTDAADRLTFTAQLAEAGTYYLFMRLDAVDNGRNSFWVQVDNGPWLEFWKETDGRNMLTNGFEWRRVNDDTEPVSFQLGAGQHTIGVVSREPGTRLDKVYLATENRLPSGTGARVADCPAPDDAVTEFWSEVECGGVGNRWATNRSSGASNQRYVYCTGDRQITEPAANGTDDRITYTANLAKAGTYHLFLRLNAIDNGRNSVWVRVDNGNWVEFWKEANGSNLLTNGFEWRRVNDDTRAVSFPLSAGRHTITLANRESGTRLDKLLLSTATQLPDGFGGPAASCSEASSVAAKRFRPASSSEPVVGNSLQVYPNPTHGAVKLRFEGTAQGRVDLRVTDVNGRVVVEKTYEKAGEVLADELDTNRLPAGMYLLHLTSGEERISRPFIKAR